MESIQQAFSIISEYIWPQWPGFMFLLTITIIAQTVKTRILTVEIALENVVVRWLRRVFPLLILLLGVLMGIFWPGEVCPGVSVTFHKVLYFVGFAGTSIVGFNIVKQWVKKKYDIEIAIAEKERPSVEA